MPLAHCVWPNLSLCRTTSHSKKGTRSASSLNPQRGPQEASRGIDAEEELRALGERRGGVRQQGEVDSSLSVLSLRKLREPLKISQEFLFCFFFFLFLLLLLLLLWTLETGRSNTQEE